MRWMKCQKEISNLKEYCKVKETMMNLKHFNQLTKLIIHNCIKLFHFFLITMAFNSAQRAGN
jgi:hypothetical protein